jgi:hypothetical protein
MKLNKRNKQMSDSKINGLNFYFYSNEPTGSASIVTKGSSGSMTVHVQLSKDTINKVMSVIFDQVEETQAAAIEAIKNVERPVALMAPEKSVTVDEMFESIEDAEVEEVPEDSPNIEDDDEIPF